VIKKTKVSFDSNGVTCIGYLYHSPSISSMHPCVVLANGFTGTQDTPSTQAIAHEFAATGFTSLTFDYRNFGESEGTPRQLISIKEQHEDIHAAILFARNQVSIDPERIALWGTSLGGGHVISVAAEDPRIAAVVAQIPFNGFPKKVESRSLIVTFKLLGVMLKDAIRGLLDLEPYYIRAVGAPDELAVMISPQAQQIVNGMQSRQWRNRVAPRVLFEMMRYKPSDKAYQLRMPVMVCIAEKDRETPADLALQIVENAPYGEYKSYPVSHFDFYHPNVRALVTIDQISFLRKHLVVDHTKPKS
jgi:dienelactone hydrolase